MDKFAVGVDFGGTKISAGVVNLETGRLVAAAKKKTRLLQEQDDIVKRLISVVDESLDEAATAVDQIAGVGIGVAGMVNRHKGILLSAANLGVNEIPLSEPIGKHYGVPCRIANDVEAATHGELSFGAGRDCDSLVCVFVGTGIGSAIVQKGLVHLGATETAGELGHTVIVPEGRECGCGGFGCLEAYASRNAVAKAILHDLNRGYDSVIASKIDMSKGILRSKAIAQAVSQGDEVCTRAVANAAYFLGIGLANVINFYNPKRLVLGGGLVEANELYFKVAESEARRRALKIPARKIEIVKAELGDYAGIIGAALLMNGD
jgi:glucokinase